MHQIFIGSMFFSAYSQSDFFGKSIFWGLYILSIISWVVLIHKIWITKKINGLSGKIEKLINSKKDAFLTLNLEQNIEHPYLNIFTILKSKTLEILNKNKFFSENSEKSQIYMCQADIELLESHVDMVISDQNKILSKNLFILSTIVTLGPFLGLLGTVWGILVTFSGLQGSSTLNNNAVVLSGLSMALATTVIGLIVAIPALVAYNYLKNSIRSIIKDSENFSHRLLSTIEIQYRRVEK